MRAVPTTAARRIGIVVVLLLLAGAALLVTLPHGAGALRLGPLSLLWWYAAVVAPLTATALTAGVLLRRPPVPPRASAAPGS
jgi:hypothetical protein